LNAVIFFVLLLVIDHPVADALFKALIQVAKPLPGGLGWLIILSVIAMGIIALLQKLWGAIVSGIF